MDTDSENQPIVDEEGELVQPDKAVDMDKYNAYVRDFRPNPRVPLWIEWDADQILTTGCIGFGIFVLIIFFLYLFTH
ncbi:MAG: hypothetical protein ABI690_06865 [Chloroflexota bacterium]